MNWTRNKPTEPGYYWLYSDEEKAVEITRIKLLARPDREPVAVIDILGQEQYDIPLEYIGGGYWIGPIPEPVPPMQPKQEEGT